MFNKGTIKGLRLHWIGCCNYGHQYEDICLNRLMYNNNNSPSQKLILNFKLHDLYSILYPKFQLRVFLNFSSKKHTKSYKRKEVVYIDDLPRPERTGHTEEGFIYLWMQSTQGLLKSLSLAYKNYNIQILSLGIDLLCLLERQCKEYF